MHKLNFVLVLHLMNQNLMKNLKIEFDHEYLDVSLGYYVLIGILCMFLLHDLIFKL